ncbi:MAG: CAP domain-containing protein [Candidatus Nanopelagicales bacterium]
MFATLIVLGLSLGLVGMAGASPAQARTSASASASQQPPAPRFSSSYDKTLLRLMNEARASRGIAPLKTTKKLSKASKKWSKKIAAKRKLSHDPNLRASVSAKAGCTSVRSWGENVAYTSDGAGSMFSMYMNSPGHRANILNSGFTHVGVKSLKRASNWGSVYWNTMKFVTARCK